MKKILCFGDSNVFGFNPETGERFDKSTRWTGILSLLCIGKYQITEAGCNNRTCFFDNPISKEMTGYKILPEYLSEDFDIVIIAIGVNDLQKSYKAKASDLENGINNLIKIIKNKSKTTEIIIVSPPIIREEILNSYFSTLFDKSAIEKSHELREIYKNSALQNECIYIDTESITRTSIIDGLHYDTDGHMKIAQKIYKELI